jgi:hypothetical protein
MGELSPAIEHYTSSELLFRKVGLRVHVDYDPGRALVLLVKPRS